MQEFVISPIAPMFAVVAAILGLSRGWRETLRVPQTWRSVRREFAVAIPAAAMVILLAGLAVTWAAAGVGALGAYDAGLFSGARVRSRRRLRG
jgi:hypothetical protein